MTYSQNISKGFTLIELLVVISIISLLSTVVLSSINTARQKATSAAVFRMVREYQVAFHNYALDHTHLPDATSPIGPQACLGPNPTTCYLFVQNSNNGTDATLNSKVAPYFSSIPYVDTGIVNVGGFKFKGLIYSCIESAFEPDPATNDGCSQAVIYVPFAGMNKCFGGDSNTWFVSPSTNSILCRYTINE